MSYFVYTLGRSMIEYVKGKTDKGAVEIPNLNQPIIKVKP